VGGAARVRRQVYRFRDDERRTRAGDLIHQGEALCFELGSFDVSGHGHMTMVDDHGHM
jgi:hypothetical protein